MVFFGSHFKKVLLARAKDVHHRFKPTEYKSASSLGIKKFSTTLVVMEKLKIAVIGKYLILTRRVIKQYYFLNYNLLWSSG